tara:strand:+ start:294 stop:557 length:264 start_codon:yes stop_codon:yes gene_type:complete
MHERIPNPWKDFAISAFTVSYVSKRKGVFVTPKMTKGHPFISALVMMYETMEASFTMFFGDFSKGVVPEFNKLWMRKDGIGCQSVFN